MNTAPVSFSIENHVYKRLIKHVPTRQRSRYVSNAINNTIVSDLIRKSHKDPWKSFFELGKKLNLNVTTEQIIEAKNFGRE